MTTHEKPFNPNDYLVWMRRDKAGRDVYYLPVAPRVYWLRIDHADATIETEMVQNNLSPDAGLCMAIFKARVTIPGAGSATGYGSETATDFADYIEKAETKAIGRALAALGYGTLSAKDFEDLSGEPHIVDAPQARPANGNGAAPANLPTAAAERQMGFKQQSTGTPANGWNPATNAQISAIRAIAKEKRVSDEELDELCSEMFQLPTSGLSKKEASQLIDRLKA